MQEIAGLTQASMIEQHAVTARRYGWVAAGVSGVMGVGFGAFAAHGLSALGDPQIVDWAKTGASYQLWHGVAVLALVGTADHVPARWSIRIISCFFWGALIFASSLYLMALSQWHWLGAITPIGGVLMILGWIMLGIMGWRHGSLRQKEER